MWLAIATTILIGFVLYLHKKQKPYNHVLSSFVCATVLLTITGHNGGSLTHGKDYLKLPDFEKEISIVSYDSIHVFNQVISPILDSKCVKCHNTGKSKGNLMLSSIDKILLGGEKGQIIKSNSSVDSRLYTYLNLPIDDEMHMPPDGNSQLNDNEKELIKLLDKYRSKDGSHDCLVPGSGGKDSVYASHILKYKYNMNPLTVTWAPHIYTDIGLKNFLYHLYEI